MAEPLDDLKGSFTDYENFVLSPIWHDMTIELSLWQNEIIHSLKTVEGNELYRYQGRAQVLDEMLKWPFKVLDVIQADKERENRQNG